MPRDEAAYHLDRCIKSGLWVPNAKDVEGEGESQEKNDGSESTDKVTEDVEKLQVE